eukprot:CAMPEP_0202906796 /NCGR_PEP_ID=MMETSP1392-20130828/40339_1 /ASSEMBLY_ACC=CAM_ASM_000868 /TAXON_ID=225041 /ORGANISM="Chlamydomonas chlamydogama, Strain SAG 11-48b" /LENGTH=31 /DNA_ID= /DNA_START= /DNA_END= /DNA_ORIENTATION=
MEVLDMYVVPAPVEPAAPAPAALRTPGEAGM